MSTPISNERLRALIDNSDTWWAGGMGIDDADDTSAALTELLSLRAEVERLRAVEQAARKLYEYEETHDRPLLRHAYMWADLAAALDATKQEPST